MALAIRGVELSEAACIPCSLLKKYYSVGEIQSKNNSESQISTNEPRFVRLNFSILALSQYLLLSSSFSLFYCVKYWATPVAGKPQCKLRKTPQNERYDGFINI